MSAAVSSEVEHILTLEAVRERARQVLQSAESGHLNHFDYDESRMPEVAEFVSGIISVGAEHDTLASCSQPRPGDILMELQA